ncbi:glycoside hydrolase family 3 protein [Caulobacter sp. NIBR2454]|uniref:glycoside hydrolase family 3 protein n=1 Tax=Caulobacter sp. NIBR2454 TaxID=3015996 RepID=UPI0022B5EDA9|nr:glycoside hydrolase family 3 protein [Caulobacter sp. NIBR2454]
MIRAALIASAAALALASGSQAQPGQAHPQNWPRSASPAAMEDAATEALVRDLLSKMTLEEKVGQTIQADISYIKPEDLKTYPLGSLLAGGSSGPFGDERGDAAKWLAMVNAFRAAAAERPGTQIPLMFGIDAVHGHNNLVGATLFPHNIGLGAARDADLVARIGVATAKEVAATGADWTFGPTLAVPRDDRWGRTYEGYGETPELARLYAGPMTLGLQGVLSPDRTLANGHIAGSAKHFLADGGTDAGLDQGDFKGDEAQLIAEHLSGYREAIDAGVLTIMASFSSWNGVKHTGNRSLLTDVLRGPLGFKGFVVGDWNAHGQVEGCSKESCAAAMNAGLDMYMAPDSWRGLYANTLAQVRSGEIPQARIDEAAARILRVKIKTGLFGPRPAIEGDRSVIGSAAHRDLAREAVAKSLVLLKNNGVLPVKPGARVLVAGRAADDIGLASGGWTISWQGTGTTNADFPGGQSIWAGLKSAVEATGGSAELNVDGAFAQKPDVAVVVFGEDPYAEFQGDVDNLDYAPTEPLALLKALRAKGVPTVALFLSGRPLWTNLEINAADAFVAAWLPGSQAGAVAEVLVAGKDGKPVRDFTGRLSFSWPKTAAQGPLNFGDAGYDPQFAYGYGLSYAKPGQVGALKEESGVAPGAGPMARYFADGRIVAPWSLTLQDADGRTMRVGQLRQSTSPAGSVHYDTIDGGAQESARRFDFIKPGSAWLGGRPVDLTSLAKDGYGLSVRYRRIDASSASVWFGVEGADQPLVPARAWTSASVPLTCFATQGAGLAKIGKPFVLRGEAGAQVEIEDVRLVKTSATGCPR